MKLSQYLSAVSILLSTTSAFASPTLRCIYREASGTTSDVSQDIQRDVEISAKPDMSASVVNFKATNTDISVSGATFANDNANAVYIMISDSKTGSQSSSLGTKSTGLTYFRNGVNYQVSCFIVE